MHFPKHYGQSKIDKCPFCDRQSTTTNQQNIPVCQKHQESIMPEFKCHCGNYLEPRGGKFGLYFYCIKCGNINKNKVLEFHQVKDVSSEIDKTEIKTEIKKEIIKHEPQEITIRSDDPNYFD